MRAAVLTRFGSPDVLTISDAPTPIPDTGQVLIRTEAIGVNFRDTWIRAGSVPAPPGTSLPLIIGNEVGGIITEVGDDAPASLVGTRVVTSTGGSGGYAEYTLACPGDLIRVPDGTDIADATALFVQGRVALGAFHAARITPSDRVLVLAAAGGVGSLLTQLVAHAGVSTLIGANRTGANAELIGSLGATHAIDYGTDTFSDQLRAIAPGGVDVVFDGIGGPIAQTALDHLATGTGRHIVYGYASGTPLTADAATLVPRGISIIGFGGQATLPGAQTALATEALECLVNGTLRPIIGQRYPLADASRAHRAIEERTTSGKTLLIP